MQRKLMMTLALGAWLILSAGSAFALEESTLPDVEPAATGTETALAEEQSVTFAGMRIAIDPQTGRMRPPTEAEAAELARAMRRMLSARPAPRQQRSRPMLGATQAFVLDPSYLRFTVARVDADGSTAATCVETPEQAERFLAEPAGTKIERGLE